MYSCARRHKLIRSSDQTKHNYQTIHNTQPNFTKGGHANFFCPQMEIQNFWAHYAIANPQNSSCASLHIANPQILYINSQIYSFLVPTR